jgi:hypothetical protein
VLPSLNLFCYKDKNEKDAQKEGKGKHAQKRM